MKPDFLKILKDHNAHPMFLNESGMLKGLEKCYDQGTEDVWKWLSKMDHLSDNVNYLKEEWENQKND
jgi:hypothetical protein